MEKLLTVEEIETKIKELNEFASRGHEKSRQLHNSYIDILPYAKEIERLSEVGRKLHQENQRLIKICDGHNAEIHQLETGIWIDPNEEENR